VIDISLIIKTSLSTDASTLMGNNVENDNKVGPWPSSMVYMMIKEAA
jgi:hypothetical protein